MFIFTFLWSYFKSFFVCTRSYRIRIIFTQIHLTYNVTLTGITIQGQNGSGNNDNKGILYRSLTIRYSSGHLVILSPTDRAKRIFVYRDCCVICNDSKYSGHFFIFYLINSHETVLADTATLVSGWSIIYVCMCVCVSRGASDLFFFTKYSTKLISMGYPVRIGLTSHRLIVNNHSSFNQFYIYMINW